MYLQGDGVAKDTRLALQGLRRTILVRRRARWRERTSGLDCVNCLRLELHMSPASSDSASDSEWFQSVPVTDGTAVTLKLSILEAKLGRANRTCICESTHFGKQTLTRLDKQIRGSSTRIGTTASSSFYLRRFAGRKEFASGETALWHQRPEQKEPEEMLPGAPGRTEGGQQGTSPRVADDRGWHLPRNRLLNDRLGSTQGAPMCAVESMSLTTA